MSKWFKCRMKWVGCGTAIVPAESAEEAIEKLKNGEWYDILYGEDDGYEPDLNTLEESK